MSLQEIFSFVILPLLIASIVLLAIIIKVIRKKWKELEDEEGGEE